VTKEEFITSLVEQHRPKIERDLTTYGEMFLVQCSACDGPNWTLRHRTDPMPYCTIWTLARVFDLTTNGKVSYPPPEPDTEPDTDFPGEVTPLRP
jgi:hypothetical protein